LRAKADLVEAQETSLIEAVLFVPVTDAIDMVDLARRLRARDWSAGIELCRFGLRFADHLAVILEDEGLIGE
jgi:hypothetical protein